jgi:thioredoxin reductase
MTFRYDVAIVGGGPAGLSAALVLVRACRRVVLFDEGQPRNQAARAVNCYLGVAEKSPDAFRELGRQQVLAMGAEIVDAGIRAVCRVEGGFELEPSAGAPIRSRKLLLATGVKDILPDVENIRDFYGRSVHHCPYCDGWEHRDQKLVGLGDGDAAARLALQLKGWSTRVTACSNGRAIARKHRSRLEANGVQYRAERAVRLEGVDGKLRQLVFESGASLACDALFFTSGQVQRSELPRMLGCKESPKNQVVTGEKQSTGKRGLFLAGDVDGDVQFAIVAAAEGAIAATAINRELQEEDTARQDYATAAANFK